MQIMSIFCFLSSMLMLFLGIVMFLAGAAMGAVDKTDKAAKKNAFAQARKLLVFAAVLMAVAVLFR